MNTWTRKTSRRAFLHGSTALAGGLLIGCSEADKAAEAKGSGFCAHCAEGGEEGRLGVRAGGPLVDAEAKVVAGLYGPCPDPFPSSLRAELRAIIQLLAY